MRQVVGAWQLALLASRLRFIPPEPARRGGGVVVGCRLRTLGALTMLRSLGGTGHLVGLPPALPTQQPQL